MKPFTFMTVVLGLILGFMLAAGRCSHVNHPPARPNRPAFLQVRYVLDDRDRENDAEDQREEAEGLPVPIVPGTRVSEARISTPERRSEANESQHTKPGVANRRIKVRTQPERKAALPDPATIRSIAGRLSATEDRARGDARLQLEREVTEWLTPEVPPQWKPPSHLLTRMIAKTEVHPIVRDYGTLYEATLDANFSPYHRSQILAAYQRQVVAHRLTVLGGSLGFILACLAALAGYIRADEATRGYYTGWLRAAAAAGVGASGVVLYQLLT